MPQFLDWIVSNFFIVIIIIGALMSVFGKKKKNPNGGAEPFGGRGASDPGRQATRPMQYEEEQAEQRQSPFGRAPAPNPRKADARGNDAASRTDARSGRTNLEQASLGMNEEIEKRLQAGRSTQSRAQAMPNAVREIDRKSTRGGGNRPKTAASYHQVGGRTAPAETPVAAADLFVKPTAEDLRKGVMWAEILGTPRARKPYHSGRR